MKKLRIHKKRISLILIASILMSCTANSITVEKTGFKAGIKSQLTGNALIFQKGNNIIKMALLLDTSSSMDGLLEQAKSQLWIIVNELAKAKKNNINAKLEIALYQYGNDYLNSKEGYIQKVLPLSSDLDELSQKLFSLTTNGGEEYCGKVINTATNQLNWNADQNELNLIFIAGNEPFNQGGTNFKTACKSALSKSITINTIYCGDYTEGIKTEWLNGAKLTEGSYMNIDMNQKTIYVETPYDQKITNLNSSLNSTYLSYGSQGSHKKALQESEDNNSSKYGNVNMLNRTISKSNHLYANETWDLVDASLDSSFNIDSIDNSTLPIVMQDMTTNEKQTYVKQKSRDRTEIKAEINSLNQKRENYLKSQPSNSTQSLDKVMINAIKKQAIAKGFYFEDSAQTVFNYTVANVDFKYFEKISEEAKLHRAKRLISFNTFTSYSKDENTIILDTRSKRMYDKMHIKGAIHINFSDFTSEYLAEMIPNKNTRLLIYCNNNFMQVPEFIITFPTKSVSIIDFNADTEPKIIEKTLALNIPTYINLFGYGYKNVYELHELVTTKHKKLKLEGTDVKTVD